MVDPDDVLRFWFGAPGAPEHGKARDVWFTRSPTFDDEIRTRFGALHQGALAGGLTGWERTPRGMLALVIVLDQFSRNLHRDHAHAFTGDARALKLARRMVASGWDRALSPLERQFVYMPFQHAEDAAMQAESVRLCRALGDHWETRDALQWAEAHERIIARFGRFPHRNAALGRTSTAEEVAFLKEPDSSF
jgi:uncharacterized protein (DUF924 family)